MSPMTPSPEIPAGLRQAFESLIEVCESHTFHLDRWDKQATAHYFRHQIDKARAVLAATEPAPVLDSELTDRQVETIYAALDPQIGMEARTVDGKRAIVEPIMEGVRRALHAGVQHGPRYGGLVAPSTPAGDEDVHDHHFDRECPVCLYLAASQPRNEDGLDEAVLAASMKACWSRHIEGSGGTGNAPTHHWTVLDPTPYTDELVSAIREEYERRIAAEYAAQSGEAAGEGEGRG